MHKAVQGLLQSLSKGSTAHHDRYGSHQGTIGRLATVYEVARNAMEYRADHLVRRAAIARILRRQFVFGRNPEELAEQLLLELQWALYLTEVEENQVTHKQIAKILAHYIALLDGATVPRDWLMGVLSAEIEEQLNPNVDYHRFTTFAFYALKNKIKLPETEELDFILYVAIDKAYSQSDEEQLCYHLYKLLKSQMDKDIATATILAETWKRYQAAIKDPLFPAISAFVRRNLGPLVLLRDTYFADPAGFETNLWDMNSFVAKANETLASQLKLVSGRIRNATVRSLLYVFLTKMLVVILVEIPLERWFGHVSYVKIGINVVIPVLVMWLLTATIRLPNRRQQEQLIATTRQLLEYFGTNEQPGETLSTTKERSGVKQILFYIFYLCLFAATFAGIHFGLRALGYSIVNQLIFLFFLCVVSFFAYRIRQTTLVYQFRSRTSRASGSLLDIVLLPIVVVGGWLSSGVARLNFLVFVFDFVLEAPFKLILRFLDNWFSFLAKKKDEIVG